MNTILRHQSQYENGHDVLVIDNEVSVYTGTPQQDQAFSIIKLDNGWKQMSIPSNLKKKCSPQIEILSNTKNKGIMIRSHFITRDYKSGVIPFSFYCADGSDRKRVVRLFEKNAKLVSMEPNPNDCKAIELATNSIHINKTIPIAIAIVVLIIILVLL